MNQRDLLIGCSNIIKEVRSAVIREEKKDLCIWEGEVKRFKQRRLTFIGTRGVFSERQLDLFLDTTMRIISLNASFFFRFRGNDTPRKIVNQAVRILFDYMGVE